MKHKIILLLIIAISGHQYIHAQELSLSNIGNNISIRIYSNDTGSITGKQQGFGYDIYLHQKKYIHQAVIPAIEGNNGFATRAQAKKVANLVSQKIINNIWPPSVSRYELDSMHIKY